MIFTDYDVRIFQPRNGAEATYTLPYRAFVTVGDYQPDDSGDPTVRITHNRHVQGSGQVEQYILRARDLSSPNNDEVLFGAGVGLSGDVVRVSSSDDMDVKVFIFRLPEENA